MQISTLWSVTTAFGKSLGFRNSAIMVKKVAWLAVKSLEYLSHKVSCSYIPYEKTMLETDTKPVTKSVSTVALTAAPSFWIPTAIIVVRTAATILVNASDILSRW